MVAWRSHYPDFHEWEAFKVQFADGTFAATRFLDGKRTRYQPLAYTWKAGARRPKPLDVLEAWNFADRARQPFFLVRARL